MRIGWFVGSQRGWDRAVEFFTTGKKNKERSERLIFGVTKVQLCSPRGSKFYYYSPPRFASGNVSDVSSSFFPYRHCLGRAVSPELEFLAFHAIFTPPSETFSPPQVIRITNEYFSRGASSFPSPYLLFAENRCFDFASILFYPLSCIRYK